MLAELHIRNLALIERQRVVLEPGLNVLSGTSGSGKSLILDALRFVIGARASQDMIRVGASELGVEALFYVDAPAERSRLQALLGEVPGLADGELVLERTLSRKGRSRAVINGRLVPVATLRELGEELCELSSQHDALALTRSADQRELLDAAGGHQPLAADYHEAYEAHRQVLARLDGLARAEGTRSDRLRAAEAELELLEELRPEPGEAEALERELARLEHAAQIRDTLGRALCELYEDEGSAHGVIGRHATAARALVHALPEADEIADQLEGAAAAVKDAARACRSLGEAVELDDSRRDAISSRLSEMHRLARRLHLRPDTLAARREALAEEVRRLADAGEAREALEAERARHADAMLARGAALSAARREAGRALEERVQGELGSLGLNGAEVRVELREEPPGPTGLDQVELLFRADPGQELKPLKRVASGGETARVMLALRTILAGRGSVPTLVFDEIDTGVGGRLGATIGRKLLALAERYQVLAVTHLAQVASFAHHHLTVEKAVGKDGAFVSVTAVEGEARVREVAAMMRGDAATDRTLQEARAMLESAREVLP